MLYANLNLILPILNFLLLWHNTALLKIEFNINMIDFFVNNAWAAPAQQQPGFMSFVPLIILFVIFYFILIRPQMKQAKQHKQLVASLAKGDEIATNGGLLGKIKEVGDNFIVVEVSKETEVKIQKQAVSIVYPKGTFKTL